MTRCRLQADEGICPDSALRFNEAILQHADSVVLTISNDLPFAQDRICKNEGIDKVITLAQMRDKSFGKDYGVEIVPETSHEHDYDAALKNLV